MTITAAFAVNVQFSNYGISTPLPAPNTFKMCQKEFEHDVAVMTFWGGDVNASALNSGTPCYIQWGAPPLMREFCGYVNHPDRTNNYLSNLAEPSDRNATTITCVGASWPMKENGSLQFQNQTVTQIIQNIATQFSLAADVDLNDDTQVWPSRQMAGQSYWKFCVGLAKLIGFTFYCNGIQLVCKPRNTNPNSLNYVAASYDLKKNPASMPIFLPTVGASSPVGGQLHNRTLAGINAKTSQIVYSQVSGSPTPTNLGLYTMTPPFGYTEHYSVASQAEADTRTSGSGQLNQMFIHAEARASGNPYVGQGSLIYIVNGNGSQNGLWYVESVEHCITKRNYEMKLCLGRDSMGQTSNMSFNAQIQTPPNARLDTQTSTWVTQQ